MSTTYTDQQAKGLSITSMVLGIASFIFGWTFLVPIAGVITGVMGIKREPAGKGFAVTGLILNGLCLIGWVVAMLIIFALGGAALFFMR